MTASLINQTVASSAENEIIKRLTQSLRNESSNINKDYHWHDTRTNLCYYKDPKSESILIISQEYKETSQSIGDLIIEMDRFGHFKRISIFPLLTNIMNIWEVPEEKRRHVYEEVNNSYENMAAAFDWEERNIEFILEKIDRIMNCSSLTERIESLRFSESLPFKGHPLHVCTKTKLGLSKNDVFKYCPEYFPQIPLNLISVLKENIIEYGNNDSWNDYLRKYTSIQPNENEIIVPVHPWQFDNVIRTSFREELAKGVMELKNDILYAFPTLSFRTVALSSNEAEPLALHVKLPVGINATSDFRLLSERDIYNGIIFSEKIKEHCTNLESVSQGKGVIVSEIYGAKLMELQEPDGQRPFLSFTLRENPVLFTQEKETLVVASSLTHQTKNIQKPLLTRFQEKSGHDIITFLNYLFRTLFNMPLELFVKYGIALEPHGQNCLISFDKSYLPQTLIYRDLGTIYIIENYPFSEIVREQLVNPHKAILSYEACIGEFFHPLLHNLSRDIINCVTKNYEVSDNCIWKMVKDISVDIVGSLDCEEELKSKFYKFILGATIPIKSLLRMRVEGKKLFTEIPNPLL